MSTVEAHLWYWTPAGMRERPAGPSLLATAYVEVSEAERLLEEAHRRGYQQALENQQAAQSTGGL